MQAQVGKGKERKRKYLIFSFLLIPFLASTLLLADLKQHTASLNKQAADRIFIMPGSGVRYDNIIEIAEKTGAIEFHTSARTTAESKMTYTNEAMKESMSSVAVDTDEIKKIINSLKFI